ncbi:PHP domain-containing protein, partial [Thermosipho sp. (in: thermotogales)]|uniref:PHP domain-containing protein n=1 Tax=Thermosipho sp. (in: thermotogales) TaxID=1968895 RepID=UPI00257CF074
MKVDFHTHSTGSDGTDTPHELLNLALEKDIEYLSITDHDTLDGIKALENFTDLKKLKFVPGVEISAEFPTTLHLLGYGFDSNNERLNKVL